MKPFRHPTRGNTAATVGLSLGVLVGFSALAVDVGMMVTARGQLNNAYDAAALGAVGYLDGEQTGVDLATAFALENAERHTVFGTSVVLVAEDIIFGRVHADNNFTFTTPVLVADINAVRINATSSSTQSAFSRIFGVTALAVAAQSTAVKPPPEGAGVVDCFLPISMRLCALEGLGSEPGVFPLSFVGNQNVAWALPGDNPTPPLVEQALNDGECAQGQLSVNQSVSLNNGVQTPTVQIGGPLASAVASRGTPWAQTAWGEDGSLALPGQPTGSTVPPGAYGKVLEGPIAIVGGECGTPMNGSEPIIQFMYGGVFDVINSGPDKDLRIVIDTLHEFTEGTGGGGPPNSSTKFEPPPTLID